MDALVGGGELSGQDSQPLRATHTFLCYEPPNEPAGARVPGNGAILKVSTQYLFYDTDALDEHASIL